MTGPLRSYLPSAALGGIAGMRTFTPGFALARHKRNAASVSLGLAALGELVGDKLPATPSRLSPPALAARLTAGATAGRALASRNGNSQIGGAIAGGASALVFAFVFYYLRRTIVERTKLPDPLVALVEDAIAIGGALALTPKPSDA